MAPTGSEPAPSDELRQSLVAILAADVVGYTRLMGVDERGTVADLDAARTLFRTEIVARGGQPVLAVDELALEVLYLPHHVDALVLPLGLDPLQFAQLALQSLVLARQCRLLARALLAALRRRRALSRQRVTVTLQRLVLVGGVFQALRHVRDVPALILQFKFSGLQVFG